MGMKTPSLISNTSFQQPSMNYSWLSTSNKMPLLNQQVSFNNPFEQNKSLYDWQNFLNGYQQQQSPDSYLNNLGASQNFLQGGLSQALNQVTSTIGNNTSSPVTKGLSMAINGIGQNVIKSVGSSVAQNVGQQIGSQVLKGGIKSISTSGLKTAASAGLKSGLKGALNAKSIGGVALSVANQFAPQKREYSGAKGNVTKSLDSAYDTLSDAISVIPGWGTAASLIMKGGALAGKFVNKWGGGTDAQTTTDAILGSNFFNLTPVGLVNGFAGKKSNTFDFGTAEDQNDRSYIAGSYNTGFIDDAGAKANKKYGYFSKGALGTANQQIYDANAKASLLKDISQKSQFQHEFGNATQNINTVNYQKKLQGYQPTYLHAGKKGMKIEKEEEFIIPDISDFKPIIATEEQVSKFKEGGSFNVIPDGALHARKHHMEDAEDLTKKGIPVVDKDGKQQAEIERDEIIFRKEVTNQIEEAMKDGSDEKAIEIGKLLVKEIFHNTQDNTGLIEEITDEKPTVEIEKKENGGTLPQLDNLDLTKLNQTEKDTLLQLLLQKASL